MLNAKFFNELSTSELYEILKSRSEIFVLEQKIDYIDEDNTDYDSLHCFFCENGRVTAYLRAYYADDTHETVKFGRVLTLVHGQGLGKELVLRSIEAVKEKMPCRRICMDAQKHAEGFYKALGFTTVSDEYLEEGVVHVDMEMQL